jgi:polygalacturonase
VTGVQTCALPISSGVWRTGSINLTSNLTLRLSAGATLLSTNDEEHYGQVPCLPNESREPIRNQGFIACWNCSNTAIEGKGGGETGGSVIDVIE